jgi:predicted XRE-type DNA-binding protein
MQQRSAHSAHAATPLRAESDQARAKAALAGRVVETIRVRGLTQPAAAACLNIDQPKVSRLVHGQWREFSTPRLLRFLALLGQDVEIVVRPAPGQGPFQLGRLRVVEEQEPVR